MTEQLDFLYFSDDVSFYSIATPEERPLLSSFVDSVIISTIYAQEKADRGLSTVMPSLWLFGSEFNWALRDALTYSGTYDTIYARNFNETQDKGRNDLGTNGGPQIHSFPGLEH